MTKVVVYRNLHKKCWSIKDRKTGLVIEHRDMVHLISCLFKVSQKGRERVLREKCKNVHAGVWGTLSDAAPCFDNWIQVRYNPYHCGAFVDVNASMVTAASEVYLTSDGKVFAKEAKHELR